MMLGGKGMGSHRRRPWRPTGVRVHVLAAGKALKGMTGTQIHNLSIMVRWFWTQSRISLPQSSEASTLVDCQR